MIKFNLLIKNQYQRVRGMVIGAATAEKTYFFRDGGIY